MPESTNLNRNVNQLKASIDLVKSDDGYIKVEEGDNWSFVATALTSSVANQVILSPTSTLVQIIINGYTIDSVANTGIVDLESSSSSVGVGGVIGRMYATKYQTRDTNSQHIHLGLGADFRVTSTTGDAVFITANYHEE